MCRLPFDSNFCRLLLILFWFRYVNYDWYFLLRIFNVIVLIIYIIHNIDVDGLIFDSIHHLISYVVKRSIVVLSVVLVWIVTRLCHSGHDRKLVQTSLHIDKIPAFCKSSFSMLWTCSGHICVFTWFALKVGMYLVYHLCMYIIVKLRLLHS